MTALAVISPTAIIAAGAWAFIGFGLVLDRLQQRKAGSRP